MMDISFITTKQKGNKMTDCLSCVYEDGLACEACFLWDLDGTCHYENRAGAFVLERINFNMELAKEWENARLIREGVFVGLLRAAKLIEEELDRGVFTEHRDRKDTPGNQPVT
jgi:hypothetical protein